MLKLLSSVKVETGNLTTPDGTPYNGFKVTVGGIQDPGEIQRRYDDIEHILHQNQVAYKINETHDQQGHFRSYSMET